MAQDGGSIEVPQAMKDITASIIAGQEGRKKASIAKAREQHAVVNLPSVDATDPEVLAFRNRRKQSKVSARFSRGRDVENTVIGSRRTDWNG